MESFITQITSFKLLILKYPNGDPVSDKGTNCPSSTAATRRSRF